MTLADDAAPPVAGGAVAEVSPGPDGAHVVVGVEGAPLADLLAAVASWPGVVEVASQRRRLHDAAAAGLVGLKGHRSAGGLRASIYNAFPRAGVDALVEFLAEFERSR